MRQFQLGKLLLMVLSMFTPLSLFADSSTRPSYQGGEVRSLGDVLIHHRYYPSHADSPPITLVLIHGWSCDASYWDAQLAALVSRYHVVTVDLAGHGQSKGSRDDLSMTAFGADVARAVQETAPDGPLVLIGHSMGGPVAIETALNIGPRVLSIVGVDTFKSIGAPPPDPEQTAARLQFFAADFVAATTTFVSQSFFRDDADAALKAKIAADMAAGDPAVGIAAIRALNEWDGAAALRALQQQRPSPVPILAINAKHGSPTNLNLLQSIYANVALQEVDGVGHFLMMEDPSRFNDILLEALAAMTAENGQHTNE